MHAYHTLHMSGKMHITNASYLASGFRHFDVVKNKMTVPVDHNQLDTVPVDHNQLDTVPVDHNQLDTVPVDHNQLDTVPVDHNQLDTVPVDNNQLDNSLSFKIIHMLQ